MLFNSHEFIFVFLPVTLGMFFLLGSVARVWALGWIIVVSLFFYAWWRPLNVLIIAPSILVNFVLARQLQRLGDGARRAALPVLVVGIAFNVAFLGYFKYSQFGITVFNDVFRTEFPAAEIILPLGISFITFQKIAFLVDVYAGRVESFTFQDYCLFVLFFPQLIAGPIVHYRELMPQFHRASCRFDRDNVSVGLTLFVFGLFKKVYLADSVAPLVSPLYDRAAAGDAMSLAASWLAAFGFTFQIYFDFSGYTDMALGIARSVGVRLPPNFDSPLRASSIIEFWLRWHMTLTRFLTSYIYNPLALSLTRRRLASGRSGFGRTATPGSFLELLVLPTLVTMLVSGIWHGAGYTFVVWGLMHGVLLTINHGWRLAAARLRHDRALCARVMTPLGSILTLSSVAATMVVFRSSTMTGAAGLLRGMLGLNGSVAAGADGTLAVWILVLALIVFACPNTLQLLDRFEPALGWQPRRDDAGVSGRLRVAWNASLPWAMAMSVIAAIGIFHLTRRSEFLYWQF